MLPALQVAFLAAALQEVLLGRVDSLVVPLVWVGAVVLQVPLAPDSTILVPPQVPVLLVAVSRAWGQRALVLGVCPLLRIPCSIGSGNNRSKTTQTT